MTHEITIKDFVEDRQRAGYTKYRTTKDVQEHYKNVHSWNQAYYQVCKYWQTIRMLPPK